MPPILKIKYQTWGFIQNQNLFDFHQENIESHELEIRNNGTLFRHLNNTYKIKFVKEKDMPQSGQLEQYESLLYVSFKNQGIKITDIKNMRENLYEIVPILGKQQSRQKMQLKEGNIVKVGKIPMKVVKIHRKEKSRTHYQNMVVPESARVSQVSHSCYFYDNENDLTNSNFSEVQENPACRYCYSHNIENDNIFRMLCACEGSTKYIHENCLIQWINMRTKMTHNQNRSVYVAAVKGFSCEICKNQFPLQRVLRFLSLKKDSLSFEPMRQMDEYVVFQGQKDGQKQFYIVDLTKLQSFDVGRHHSCDLILTDLSISRKHCQVHLNSKKQLQIFDLNSKFGTALLKKYVVVKNKKEYHIQKGRTIFRMKMQQKKSFLGFFCHPSSDQQ